MSNSITELLANILAAKYGEEVRGSIHDAIELCYTDGKAGVNDLQARQLIETVAAVNEEQAAALEVLEARVEELESGEGGSSQQSTTIDIPTVLVDGGVVENVSVNNNGTTTRHITFTTEFTETPKVMVAIGKNVGAVSQYGYLSANILYPTVTTTGFDFFLANRTGSDRSPGVVWYAYQPTVKTIDLDITIPETEGMTEAEVREITGPIASAVNSIKTGYDGTTYQTAAEAVRTQINDLHVLIGDEPGTAISADSIGYEDGSVADALDGLNGRLTEVEGGSSGVPSDVRKALVTLAKAVTYMPDLVTDETGETPYNFSAEFALLEAWASTRATAITLSESSISFTGAGTKKLTATLTPADADDTVRWSTSNPNVASVSSNGTVTAVGNGSCIIAASVGSVTANCSVTVSGVALMRTVTNTLTGCTNSNSAATVADGGSYTGTLTATTGHTMTGATVTVLMGGTDVTSTAYSNGVISIANVTGNIEITAVADESPVYAFENGTYTFSNGHSVTVADGNIVTLNLVSSGGNDVHANISSVSENTATSNAYAANYASGTEKLFSIPAGATVRAVITPLEITPTSSGIMSKKTNIRMNRQTASWTSEDVIAILFNEVAYSTLTVGTPVEKTVTVENAVDVYTISAMAGRTAGQGITFKYDIKIYVNGVRFI